jgi:Fuc2NAc and GlcNAc transferase
VVAGAAEGRVITFALAAVVAAALVGLARWDAVRRGLIDHPQERSSHAVPTPRGGGLGLLLAVAIALVAANDLGAASREVLFAAAAVVLVAMIGWVDDHGGAAVGVRLAVHLAAGALIVPFALAAPLPLAEYAATAWWIFWTVSAINVVNFIDGIDGLIGLQALIYGVFVALLSAPGGGPQLAGLALAGASLGFLGWNWNPARIFMGDVGSGALGAVFVLLGAALVAEGRVGFVAAYAPLAGIFLDAAVTLVRRARRGERLSQAHRTHLYQRLANGGLGHARVALLYGAFAAACGALALLLPHGGLILLAAVLGALVAVGALLERRAARAGDPPMLA